MSVYLSYADEQRLLDHGTIAEVEEALGKLKRDRKRDRDRARELIAESQAVRPAWDPRATSGDPERTGQLDRKADRLYQQAQELREQARGAKEVKDRLEHRLWSLKDDRRKAEREAREAAIAAKLAERAARDQAKLDEERERRERELRRQPSLWGGAS